MMSCIIYCITDGTIVKKKVAQQMNQGKSKQELQRDYWNRMSNIIDDKSYRIWNV